MLYSEVLPLSLGVQDAHGLCEELNKDCPVPTRYKFEVRRLLEASFAKIKDTKLYAKLAYREATVWKTPAYPLPP